MRGYKPISLEQFGNMCEHRGVDVMDSGYYKCNDPDQNIWFCCSDCRYWRKLGRADIKVVKVTANNKSKGKILARYSAHGVGIL